MIRSLLQGTFVLYLCYYVTLFPGREACAGSKTEDAEMEKFMKKHIEEVKLKNPAKYKAVVDKAGGNITSCTSCHQNIKKGGS